jgi:hypothetical protein
MTPARALRYEIRIRGHLDESHALWLEGFSLRHEVTWGKPYTVLSGVLPDQAALYGLLNKLSAMSMSLVDLHEQEP